MVGGVRSVPSLSLEKISAPYKTKGCDGSVVGEARWLAQHRENLVEGRWHGNFGLEKKEYEEMFCR